MNRILQQIRQQASLRPLYAAIFSSESTFNYARLISEIDRVADLLKQNAVRRLGLYLDNSAEWIVVDLACAQAEVTVVPLPWFFSSRQLNHIVQSSDLDAVVSHENYTIAPFSSARSLKLFDDIDLWLNDDERQMGAGDVAAFARVSFTSGSTGNPRGIPLYGELIEDVCQSIVALTRDLEVDRHLSLLPYSTLLENICGIYVPLMSGKTVYAEPSQTIGLSSKLNIDQGCLAKVLTRTQAQSLIVTPQLLKLLCILVERGLFDPSSLRFVAVGGAPVGSALIERARSHSIPVFEGYGLTEFASVVCLNTPQQSRIGSVGRPLAHVIVDFAEDGEILLRHKSRPFTAIATGDLGSIDADGFVYIEGRKKNIVVLSTGRNVSPEWVEAEMLGSPLMSQCLVFGEGEAGLSAIVFTQTEIATEKIGDSIGRINRQLPAYARVGTVHRIDSPLSIENGLMTETGKPKRVEIIRRLPGLLANAETMHLPQFESVVTNL